MIIAVCGKNSVAVESVKYLLKHSLIKKDKLIICTNKTDTGIDTWQPSLKKYAIENDIIIKELNELESEKDLLIISLEYDKLININKFSTKKIFNIHFSLLPKYKGVYTSVHPILNGENESGVTLHCIDEGIDTGNIIDQKSFQIDLHDTCRDLYFKYLNHGYKLFENNINKLINDDFISYQQPNTNSTYYSKKSIDFKNIIIDLKKTSFEIHNQIRAFIFKEYQLPVIQSYLIKKSLLTNDKIKNNYFADEGKNIIISGIDGYKIVLEKDNDKIP